MGLNRPGFPETLMVTRGTSQLLQLPDQISLYASEPNWNLLATVTPH